MKKIENQKQITSNILWNTIGSLFYLGCQWLLSVAIVRLYPEEEMAYTAAGILSICTSITGVFFIIALFNVKNFQVSDRSGVYSDGDFVCHRMVTCLLAFVACAVFVLLRGYSPYVTLCVLFYMLLKCLEAMIDAYHGIAQTIWRLDIAGKSFIMRGLLMLASFVISLSLTKNLAFAILCMPITCLIPALLYDARVITRCKAVKLSPSLRQIMGITKICTPMVLYGICVNSILPVARLVLEFYHGETALGYYSTVSSIALLVQSLVSFIFSPLINIFASAYEKNDRKTILKLLVKLFFILAAVTLLALLASLVTVHFSLLAPIFGTEILPYSYLLYPTVIASCITALVWLLGMLLVVMQDNKTLFWGAFIGLVGCTSISFLTIQKFVYLGTNIAVITGLSITAFIFTLRVLKYLFAKAK